MSDNHLTWDILLRAWLHDPVDKPADIRGHESRAERYASLVLNEPVSIAELKFREADPTAAAIERLPMPSIGGDFDNLAVAPSADKTLRVIHPFSGAQRDVAVGVDEPAVQRVFLRLAPHQGGRRTDFLSLWRHGPEQLAAETGLDFENFPAETRNPDHTLWQHLDTTAAFALASYSSASRATLLSFKLGPVQPFIEASRSIRDLLTGSWLLSILAFAAIEPVLEACGPTALVYPALRGLPFMDWWLRKQAVPGVEIDPEDLARPSIPHRFLAIVPSDKAATLAAASVESARARWRAIATKVRLHLNEQLGSSFPGWDRLWDAQVESFFDFRTSCVEYSLSEEQQRSFLGDEPLELGRQVGKLGFTGDIVPGHWQRLTKISSMLMESVATSRHVPAYALPEGDVPQKCTLMGSYEQMGPAKLADSTAFWTEFHKQNSAGEDADDPDAVAASNRRLNDRLCAVALTKRLAVFEYAVPELQIPRSAFRIPDTRRFAKLAGPEFRYYAILAFDGDRMGRWLSGENALRIADALHPKIADYHRERGRESVLELPRPMSPALHAEFSARLTRFASKHVPEIVKRHEGTLVYSGGDDVLAALPLTRVLDCAWEIRKRFSSDDVLGTNASGSAGISIAHYQEDLRAALQAARNAEKLAKSSGRDRLAIAALRRSGGPVTADCPWVYVQILKRQFDLFNPQGAAKMSDRWTYALRAEIPVLCALPPEVFQDEMRRILKRSEGAKQFADELLQQFRDSGLKPATFLDLAQTASFMTRGNDN